MTKRQGGVRQMTTKTEFEAFIAARCSLHVRNEPRKERDGEYLYECFDNEAGEEVAFVSWRSGVATYTIREG